MDVLRTPDEQFENLPDYDFEPHYVDVAAGDGSDDKLRVHYLDEGPSDGDVVLLMHGEPSWCFLYRHMIPGFADAGFRAVAPDLVGFGRSDKPTALEDYTYAKHVEWMREALFDHLGLEGITFFGQDWGGLVGLRLVAEHPDRFARAVAGNTGLATGDRDPGEAFRNWQTYSQTADVLPIGRIVNGGCTTDLSEAVVAGYDAPFPDESYKAGARIFPTLVPTRPNDPASDANRAAWKVFESWEKPFLTAFSDSDPITAGGFKPFRKLIPGAQGRDHPTIAGAGHFLQEDKGPELAEVIIDFITST